MNATADSRVQVRKLLSTEMHRFRCRIYLDAVILQQNMNRNHFKIVLLRSDVKRTIDACYHDLEIYACFMNEQQSGEAYLTALRVGSATVMCWLSTSYFQSHCNAINLQIHSCLCQYCGRVLSEYHSCLHVSDKLRFIIFRPTGLLTSICDIKTSVTFLSLWHCKYHYHKPLIHVALLQTTVAKLYSQWQLTFCLHSTDRPLLFLAFTLAQRLFWGPWESKTLHQGLLAMSRRCWSWNLNLWQHCNPVSGTVAFISVLPANEIHICTMDGGESRTKARWLIPIPNAQQTEILRPCTSIISAWITASFASYSVDRHWKQSNRQTECIKKAALTFAKTFQGSEQQYLDTSSAKNESMISVSLILSCLLKIFHSFS